MGYRLFLAEQFRFQYRSSPARAGAGINGGNPRPLHQVFPRAGGGRAVCPYGHTHKSRSSPARAGAGKTTTCGANVKKVFPRAGGGGSQFWNYSTPNNTSSPARAGAGPSSGTIAHLITHLPPRGRGRGSLWPGVMSFCGSSPARAGAGRLITGGFIAANIFPRAGGGGSFCPCLFFCFPDLPPRGRGRVTQGKFFINMTEIFPRAGGGG